MATTRKILVVDDNRLYREAVRRNLEFVDYQVLEAEDLPSALNEIRTQHPQAVITDLDMTHRTEGLDLIREVKTRYPLMPVILVSAVGTFEEGAKAQELGATAVISKSRIDEELEHLYANLDDIFEQVVAHKALKTKVEQLVTDFDPDQAVKVEEDINQMISSIQYDMALKGELYEWISRLKDQRMAKDREGMVQEVAGGAGGENLQEIQKNLEEEVGPLDEFDPETQAILLAAERMMRDVDPETNTGWARNLGFSYSFAVENEIKNKIEKKFGKFITSSDLKNLLPKLYDSTLDNLSLGLSRYFLLQKGVGEEITQDLVRQILERMRKHGAKYKADGLKALGVVVFLFGRDHRFDNLGSQVEINSPLGLKGLTQEETNRLALLLVRLQHIRNPFIHPEFTEREKIGEMRKLVIECLGLVKKIEG
ncbi:MAG: response regulator [Candidatus Omnitrophica bacterium]|nr:response regulator [Candidatus Omnitrophota bacterium]